MNSIKKRYDTHRLPNEFQTGDLVWYKWNKTTDDKLTAKYKGPYVIKNPVGTVCFRITCPENNRKTKIVHIQDLKKYINRPNFDTPETELFTQEDIQILPKDNSPQVESSAKVLNSPTKENDSKRQRRPPVWHKDYVPL